MKNIGRKKLILNIGIIALIIFASTLLFSILYFWNSLGESYSEIDRIDHENDGDNAGAGDVKKDGLTDPYNILLLGVDSNDYEVGRSDTIMVIRLNPNDKSIKVVSLPRDTYTEIVGKGYSDKVNHSMQYGLPTVLATVENFFNIRIDHYATIDFQGFKKAIDALGGVEINVEKRMRYTDVAGNLYIDLQPGLQVLNGEQALGYSRFRSDAMGDLGRVKRQQEVIKAVIDESTEFRSATHLFELMDIVGEHFKTDIPRTDLLKILTTYRNVTSENMTSITINGESKRFGEQNLWYYVVSDEERIRLNEELQK